MKGREKGKEGEEKGENEIDGEDTGLGVRKRGMEEMKKKDEKREKGGMRERSE